MFGYSKTRNIVHLLVWASCLLQYSIN